MTFKLLAVAVLTLGLAACNTSYSYFEDDDEGVEKSPGGFNLAHTLMKQTGVVPTPRQRLAYKPRAPIAIPTTPSLPPPQQGPHQAEASVNFPVDHAQSEKDRKEQLAAAFNRGDQIKGLRDDTGATTRNGLVRLPPEALAKRPERDNSEMFRDKNPVRSLKEMRKKLNFRQPSETLLTEEGKAAPRKYLIQPPDEYRTPAATAALPEEGDIENSEWVDKQLYKGIKKQSLLGR